MFSRRVIFVMLSVFGYVIPANALTANLSVGTATNPDTGTKDGGSFTTTPFTSTSTFNTGKGTLTTTGTGAATVNTYIPNNAGNTLTYTWTGTATAIKNDQYAPPPPNGNASNTTAASTTNNTSLYLAVFSGSPVTITSTKLLNYIGIDWGYADAGNQIDFYNGTTLLKTYTSASLYGGTVPNPESSSYINFVADNGNDLFNKIVLSETSTSGFETDNYAVKVAPVPSSTFGLLALGAMGAWEFCKANRKSKQKQQAIE